MHSDGRNLDHAKLLWIGNFQNGSITVPELDDYILVGFRFDNSIQVPVMRTFGTGIYRQFLGHWQAIEYESVYPSVAYYFRYGYYSSNTLTIDSNCKGFLDGNGQVGSYLTAIYGLVKNPI